MLLFFSKIAALNSYFLYFSDKGTKYVVKQHHLAASTALVACARGICFFLPAEPQSWTHTRTSLAGAAAASSHLPGMGPDANDSQFGMHYAEI